MNCLRLRALFVLLSICGLNRSATVADESNSIKLYVLDGGATRLDKAAFDAAYRGQGEIQIEVRAFLIVHPKGNLLWDTGHSDKYLGRGWVDKNRFAINVRKGILSQLDQLGYSASDIDRLAFSHWHYDHTGNANFFSNAIITGQKDEYDLAFGPVASRTFGLDPSTYRELYKNNTDLFQGDRDVFGDGKVKILRASGHTIGSQVLYVELAKYGPVLLSGDLWHFREQRERKSVPPFNNSIEETIESMKKIETFLQKHPQTKLWITHDPEQMRALRCAPQFYD
jgi:N-acyl homoserine lactone hydrolase